MKFDAQSTQMLCHIETIVWLRKLSFAAGMTTRFTLTFLASFNYDHESRDGRKTYTVLVLINKAALLVGSPFRLERLAA